MRTFPLHTALAILTAGLLLAGVHRVKPAIPAPRIEQLRAVLDVAPEGAPMTPLVVRVEPEHIPFIPVRRGPFAVESPLLNDSNGVLDHFYAALWRTERREKDGITRIVHYGDSPTTADLITGDVRTMLQKRFGNAGHGFILVAKPWAWYQHAGTTVSGSGWQIAPATHFESRDGLFGLGGVAFTGGPSARSRIVLKDVHTQIEVFYLQQPDGGAFTVLTDGRLFGRVETAAQTKTPGFAAFNVPDGARTIEVEGDTGSVRLFGVTAERDGPGVVYDSLGLNGASVGVMTHMFNERHWAAELQHRAPALVIVNYGTNEADFASFVDKQYEKELREAIRRIRAALPVVSILVMSPMDRGRRGEKEIETMPTIPRIVAIQKRVAGDTACGFFDTFTAMGGEGTMARWYAAQPRLVSADFIHPYPAGGKLIAEVFVRELGAGLNRYKGRQVAVR